MNWIDNLLASINRRRVPITFDSHLIMRQSTRNLDLRKVQETVRSGHIAELFTATKTLFSKILRKRQCYLHRYCHRLPTLFGGDNMLAEKGSLKCDCGGTFIEQPYDFEGITSQALACDKCGHVTLNLQQAERLGKLKELQGLLAGERKLIKMGNSIGLTLPRRLTEYGFKVGSKVKIVPKGEGRFEVSVQTESVREKSDETS